MGGIKSVFTGMKIAHDIINLEKEIKDIKNAINNLDKAYNDTAKNILDNVLNQKKSKLKELYQKEWTPLYEQQ